MPARTMVPRMIKLRRRESPDYCILSGIHHRIMQSIMEENIQILPKDWIYLIKSREYRHNSLSIMNYLSRDIGFEEKISQIAFAADV